MLFVYGMLEIGDGKSLKNFIGEKKNFHNLFEMEKVQIPKCVCEHKSLCVRVDVKSFYDMAQEKNNFLQSFFFKFLVI